MAQEADYAFIIISIVIFLLLGGFMVLLFLIFLKRKNKLLINKKKAEENYKREIIASQIEIREETLRNISWELHDNIGQLMALAKIHAQNAVGNPAKMEAVSEIIGQGLDELRALSKTINPDTIRNLDITEALQLEISRFNRLKFIDASLKITGDKIDIDAKVSVILFRILQEFFSNTIKHAQATTLEVSLIFTETTLMVAAFDNGIGFNDKNKGNGIGLSNMHNRAKLIGGDLKIESVTDKGTRLRLTYSPNENTEL